MKRFIPADPAKFQPLPWQRNPATLRALVLKPALVLPSPARVALAAFVVCFVVAL